MKLALIFDTETSGLAKWKAPFDDPYQPDIIQIGAVLSSPEGVVDQLVTLVNPGDVHPDWVMQPEAEATHGFSREQIEAEGISTRDMLAAFGVLLAQAGGYVCHNVDFDKMMLAIAHHRAGLLEDPWWISKPNYCTMKKSANFCKIPGRYQNSYKWPKLTELHSILFDEGFDGAHDALNDVMATRRCYYELRRRRI